MVPVVQEVNNVEAATRPQLFAEVVPRDAIAPVLDGCRGSTSTRGRQEGRGNARVNVLLTAHEWKSGSR